MKILAVEDDPVAALVIESTLKSLGHEVTLVADVSGALQALQKAPFRVVVSDWQMEGPDGLDLCRIIRSRPGDYVYFILLTQQDPSEANQQTALEAGTDDFLTKPIRVHEMRARQHVAERIVAYTQQVNQLESFLPICMHCKKIRDDQNYWEQIENYIGKRTGSRFSHGICPDCYRDVVLPDLVKLGMGDVAAVPRPPPVVRAVSPPR